MKVEVSEDLDKNIQCLRTFCMPTSCVAEYEMLHWQKVSAGPAEKYDRRSKSGDSARSPGRLQAMLSRSVRLGAGFGDSLEIHEQKALLDCWNMLYYIIWKIP